MMDLTGRKFGRLSVLRFSVIKKRSSWECRCECGSIRVVRQYNLLNGNSRSCGCLMKDTVWTHGHTSRKTGITDEYRIWATMKQRCSNPKSNSYERYGGRGIKVCRRWVRFENFFTDMGKRPSKSHSIERKNNNKGYSP